ncbi:hypothetical protein [Amycolatopsis cihanbeyliensis]|uniref:Tetratricopeptide repeat protein n=1 Tax=Amycolatopsis cihanbeyliensis TaxID=1128664 RepID=A0A542DNV9_AMYCI|nr:hypothetical protein [Amycolatopsis cihanbeyliensis]TQJ04780.1 hypothetical protein FB471_4589 [Amycolatopsis cihanbeyliensis]
MTSTDSATAEDPAMAAIAKAVTRGRTGDPGGARDALLELWRTVSHHGDPLHLCTLAHYLADLHEDPAEALAWDIRALDAADRLADDRAQRHHPSLRVRGFYPSLHLNIADNYRRLGSFAAARKHLAAAEEFLDALPADDYGRTVRTAITEVGAAVRARSTLARTGTANSGT